MLLKIAWRNLLAQPAKTLIIGILIALGIALLVIGNSLASSVDNGIQKSYIESLTGDMILRGKAKENDGQIDFISPFSPNVMLDNYPAVADYLQTRDDVRQFTPVLHGAAQMQIADEITANASLWGIKPTEYFEVFADTFSLTEGTFWAEDETGIILTEGFREAIKTLHDKELQIGDTVSLTGNNITTGVKIRQVTIRGFGRFNNDESDMFLTYLTDPGTVRYLSGLTLVKEAAAVETETVTVNEDDFFGGGSLFNDVSATVTETTTDYDSILGDTSRRDKYLALDNNAWHFVLLRLTEGANSHNVQRDMQSHFVENPDSSQNMAVETWRWGAKQTLGMVTALQIALNVAIAIVAVVSVIIIMNTLVIAVSERTAEIGTIRAIGGQKGFVRGMVITEVLTITVVFGIIGMLLGGLVIWILNKQGIPASNDFLSILFGGETFRPTLSLFSLWISLLAVSIIGMVASLYPTSIALGISPVKAMSK